MLTVKWDPPIDQLLTTNAAKMPKVVKDVLVRLGIVGQGYGKRITPVDTARLRKGVNWNIPGPPELYIGSNVTYAPIILGDVKPFTITAKRKKALAWVDKGHVRPMTKLGWRLAREAGIAHYAKSIRHPGGKNVLGRTEQYLEGKIPGVVASILSKHGITS